MFYQINFSKFVTMMNILSLNIAYYFSSLRELNFIVNWLVNPRFGGDFFCANFLGVKYKQNISEFLWQD